MKFKKEGKVLLIIVISAAMAVISMFMTDNSDKLFFSIKRPEPGEESQVKRINVVGEDGESITSVDVEIAPRIMTQDEAAVCFEKAYEEKEEFDSVCKKYDMDLISLIAPTSHERISMIAKEASGFVYCVSSLGVTGTRSEITTDIGAMAKLVKKAKDIPCAVGFGISTPDQAKKMAGLSDGAIVGSAIVKLCGTYGKDAVPYVKEYVKSMCDAVHGI